MPNKLARLWQEIIGRKVLLIIFFLPTIACKEFEQFEPALSTCVVESIADDNVRISAYILDDGGSPVITKGICWGASANPTIGDHVTDEGRGTGSFVSTISNLEANTSYYLRAYATNKIGVGYSKVLKILTRTEPVIDCNGNEYLTIAIGDQIWMAENLRVTNYEDGTAIKLVEMISQWEGLSTPEIAYSWYDNNISYKESFGALYTWAATMNGMVSGESNSGIVQGVCPEGWHVPSDKDWEQLELYLGMSPAESNLTGARGYNIGSMLAGNPESWIDGLLKNSSSFGFSGFSALPGGGRRYNGTFGRMGENANFWTSTEYDNTLAWGRHLYSKYSTVHRYTDIKSDGFSVRCVKDNITP